MEQEFCTHLEDYATRFVNAREVYQDCLVAMDAVLAGEQTEEAVGRVQTALDAWERQTRDLRSQFARLNKTGEILLPREGQNDQPVCAHCGAQVPRLEFSEFSFTEDGVFLYRGEPLLAPEPVAG